MNDLPELPADARALCEGAAGLALWLTGAGISAESGVPTFRGKDGYWTVGSTNYRAEELATYAAFSQMPEDVWAWYLYRRGVCRGAEPNAAHRAIAELEAARGERHLLVTQNVDGLHLRAGSTAARTYEIHGNLDYARPVAGGARRSIPASVEVPWAKDRALGPAERDVLLADDNPLRPHVLWFDESYDEANFRFESTLHAASQASLVIVVGTTGATNLPLHIGRIAVQRGAPMIVVNPEPNPFSEWVDETGCGVFLQGTAGEWVPALCKHLTP
ncbi:MAG: Sir2 family NAD-dependent protein deacetylase [Myxococcota bacterium]